MKPIFYFLAVFLLYSTGSHAQGDLPNKKELLLQTHVLKSKDIFNISRQMESIKGIYFWEYNSTGNTLLITYEGRQIQSASIRKFLGHYLIPENLAEKPRIEPGESMPAHEQTSFIRMVPRQIYFKAKPVEVHSLAYHSYSDIPHTSDLSKPVHVIHDKMLSMELLMPKLSTRFDGNVFPVKLSAPSKLNQHVSSMQAYEDMVKIPMRGHPVFVTAIDVFPNHIYSKIRQQANKQTSETVRIDDEIRKIKPIEISNFNIDSYKQGLVTISIETLYFTETVYFRKDPIIEKARLIQPALSVMRYELEPFSFQKQSQPRQQPAAIEISHTAEFAGLSDYDAYLLSDGSTQSANRYDPVHTISLKKLNELKIADAEEVKLKAAKKDLLIQTDELSNYDVYRISRLLEKVEGIYFWGYHAGKQTLLVSYESDKISDPEIIFSVIGRVNQNTCMTLLKTESFFAFIDRIEKEEQQAKAE